MITCCGEALMDMLPRRLEDGSEAFLPVPGGAIFNTAIALGRLGEDVCFLSGISSDMFGRKLITHLQDSGVGTAHCVRSSRPTTLAFVTLRDGNAVYTFFDENSAGRMLSEDDLPPLPETVEALHFGAISLIAEPCGSTYEALMRRQHKTSVISLDPNIRPGFIADEPSYRQRLQRMIDMCDVIKLSEEDLDWIEPGKNFDHAIRELIARGVSVVVLTMGANGARAVTCNQDITVPAKPVEVIDTVGAGDTFNAGFLAGLRESGHLSKELLKMIDVDDLRSAIELGSRVAAYTVGQAGANPPWRKDLA